VQEIYIPKFGKNFVKFSVFVAQPTNAPIRVKLRVAPVGRKTSKLPPHRTKRRNLHALRAMLAVITGAPINSEAVT